MLDQMNFRRKFFFKPVQWCSDQYDIEHIFAHIIHTENFYLLTEKFQFHFIHLLPAHFQNFNQTYFQPEASQNFITKLCRSRFSPRLKFDRFPPATEPSN